jgi:hypothetical protein
MRKLLIFAVGVVFFGSCCSSSSDEKKHYTSEELENMSAQEFYDVYMRHDTIKDRTGHELILHEVGRRGQRNYSFSIEHSQECKECYAIYD